MTATIEYNKRTGAPTVLPPGPLIDYLDRTDKLGFSFNPQSKDELMGMPGGLDGRHAERCGVSSRTVTRWREGKAVRMIYADRVAVALGLHPLNIWPDLYDEMEP